MDKNELEKILNSPSYKQIDLKNLGVLKQLVELLEHENSTIRNNSAELLFKADLVPIEEILKRYIDSQHPFIKQQIISHLDIFIPILSSYLVNNDYFPSLYSLLSDISSVKIYEAIEKAHQTAPQLSALTELAIRTCHTSFSEFEKSLITYQVIANNSSEIKKIILAMLNQTDPTIIELTLRTIIKFPELAVLVEKQLKNIVKQSNNPKHVNYASLGLMQTRNPKNADVLISRLELGKDPEEVQLTLIETLGNLGNIKAKKVLLNQFSKGEKFAYYAAQALSLFGEQIIPDLIKELKRDESVPHIIEVLKRFGENIYNYLLDALEHGPTQIRKNVVQCFAFIMSEKHGYEGAIEHLTRQLYGKKERVVEAIIDGLLTLGTPAINILIEKLQIKDIQFRKNAINVLQHFGLSNIEIALDDELAVSTEKSTKLGLLLYLYYPDENVKNLGKSFALHKNKLRTKTDELFEIIKNALSDADPTVREKACEMLRYFGARSVPLLIKALSDHNIRIRRAAIQSLRTIRSKRALIALLDAATDKDAVIAETATRALGELGDPAVIDTLIKNLNHQNELIRDAAIYAIVSIGSHVIPKLSPLLAGGSKRITEGIINASIRIGPPALDKHLEYIDKGNETWFNNIKAITKGIGNSAEKVLLKHYKHTRKLKSKAQIGVLLAQIGRSPPVSDVFKHLGSKLANYAIETINLLGPSVAPEFIEVIRQQSSTKVEQVLNKTKKLDVAIIYEFLNLLKNDEKLCHLSKKIIKNNGKRLKQFCIKNNVDYNAFVKECMKPLRT